MPALGVPLSLEAPKEGSVQGSRARGSSASSDPPPLLPQSSLREGSSSAGPTRPFGVGRAGGLTPKRPERWERGTPKGVAPPWDGPQQPLLLCQPFLGTAVQCLPLPDWGVLLVPPSGSWGRQWSLAMPGGFHGTLYLRGGHGGGPLPNFPSVWGLQVQLVPLRRRRAWRMRTAELFPRRPC